MLAKQALYHLGHTSSSFCFAYFEDGVSGPICPGWPQTKILSILVSHLARFIELSHHHLLHRLKYIRLYIKMPYS
jgi:hypothetical protein